MKQLYSDLKKHYVILEFHRSQSQLLIRCLKSEVDKIDYNIDILFMPVRKMILPDTFEGIEIYVLEDNEIPEFLINNFGFSSGFDYGVFLIKTRDSNSYYINAMLVGVFHNELDMLESRWDRLSYYLGEEKLFYMQHEALED